MYIILVLIVVFMLTRKNNVSGTGAFTQAPNFTFEEFNCKDGNKVPVQYYDNLFKVTKNMQVLRDYLGKKVNVHSGYRSPTYNAKIGGVKNSFHKVALACDFSVDGVTPIQMRAIIEKLIAEGRMDKGGLGTYGTFTHYDAQGVNRRWYG